jgi:hypothetical protein
MNNTLLGSLIQSADGAEKGSLRFGYAGIDGAASILDRDAGGATVNTVAQTTLIVLAVTLDLGLNISHLLPPYNIRLPGRLPYLQSLPPNQFIPT